MALLTIGSILFNRDANDLVVEPIERLQEKIRLMALNPVGIINEELEN